MQKFIGTMSGTSMDGVDVAVLETDGESIGEPGQTYFRKYSKDERALIEQAIEAAANGESAGSNSIAAATKMIEEAHIEAINKLMEEANLHAKDVEAVGFHGQTIFHAPQDKRTWQIGDGERVAKALGTQVVYDMRSADVAAGGEGAPLVPVFHEALLKKLGAELPAAVINIGGVANVTIVDENGIVSAFDTGPGNALIDDWMASRTSRKFDQWGRIAGEGTVQQQFVDQMLAHPYFSETPPKSLDRNTFDILLIDRLSLADGSATLTAFSAQAMALALKGSGVKAVYTCGGGSNNLTMMKMLREASGVDVSSIDDATEEVWDSAFIEAQAFAFLSARVLKGLPLTFPQTTNCPEPMTGGKVARP